MNWETPRQRCNRLIAAAERTALMARSRAMAAAACEAASDRERLLGAPGVGGDWEVVSATSRTVDAPLDAIKGALAQHLVRQLFESGLVTWRVVETDEGLRTVEASFYVRKISNAQA